MALFAMVSTRPSVEYTQYALKSFFLNTKLEFTDRFVLIDNDQSLSESSFTQYKQLELIQNVEPKSFAQNINFAISEAMLSKQDVYFLNNDLIFTPDWILPIQEIRDALVSPLSNREVQYQTGNFIWGNVLQLEQYLERPLELFALLEQHHQAQQGYQLVVKLPFFCIKIPYQIYSVVGEFDLNFGIGGAEDDDYCIRTLLAGFKIVYARSAFVLHFSGRSTWAGAENKQQTEERVAKFHKHFLTKWGKALYRLYMEDYTAVIEENPELLRLVQQAKYKEVLEKLLEEKEK